MSMKWRVLVSAPYFLTVFEEYKKRLVSEGVELVAARVNERLSEEELLTYVIDIDGIICGDDRITERVIAAAPRLKVISKWGTGIDSIDVAAANRQGIPVYRTPDAFSEPVADTVLGYILIFARQLPRMDRDIRDGIWEKPALMSVRECVLGVIGVGNCGKAVVRRAVAFGMRVLGNDIKDLPRGFIDETGLEVVSLEELVVAADFISLNPDLNPTSFHLISRKELAKMKRSAYLINTSRGPVIDEAALVEALQKQRIGGAALDVFEEEPLPAESPLRGLQNCLLAPHNANSSPAAWRRVHENTALNLLDGLQKAR